MNIQSTIEKDIRSHKLEAGAYEWWYFDAISDDGATKLVIIFYEGNPFSRRYIEKQENGTKARAEDFPAISISIYRNHKPIYYSFTEISKDHAEFGEDTPFLRIADHQMEADIEDDKIIYKLTLQEKLPSGDEIMGHLTFKSSPGVTQSLPTLEKNIPNHWWNLMQPRARVSGKLHCKVQGDESPVINFKGWGYHDHNKGKEPLKNRFDEWYWGRFHFSNATLIYYLTGEEEQKNFGWLVNGDQLLQKFTSITKKDTSRTIYGLSTSRKLLLSSAGTEVLIQQHHLLDNGPFYQRFSSEAFLNSSNKSNIESVEGITEYICPPRIYNRIFWPLTNMRIHYKAEHSHWVQRSKTLYRWTW